MSPKRKATSAFSGPGRVLGSGGVKPAKRPRKYQQEEDADYVLPQEEKDEANEQIETKPKTRKKPEKGRKASEKARKESKETTGCISALDVNGKPFTVDVSKIHALDGPRSGLRADDPMRYGGRTTFAALLEDEWVDGIPTYEWFACKKGTLFRQNERRFVPPTKEQIAKWKAEDDGIPCECRLCVELTAEDV